MGMSEKPIGVGDLVMVMRNHCNDIYTGLPFRVLEITAPGICTCGACGRFVGHYPLARLWADSPLGGLPIHWLKRIDPDPNAISEDARKPIEETA